MTFDEDITYWVRADRDRTALLARNVRTEDARVQWFDTTKDRSVRSTAIRVEGEEIIVETERGTYRFAPLTVERYEAHVRSRVAGRPEFFEDEDVQRYYQRYF